MASQIATSTSVIDLAGLRPEPHVERAFRTALALADEGPIQAGDALMAAVLVARGTRSEAFRHLEGLVSGVPVPKAEVAAEGPDGPSKFAVSRALAEAFGRARPFLEDDIVWGRDYVAIALTAVGDPSLDRLAGQAGTTAGALRAAWLEFVTSQGERRDPEAWSRWWATVPPPPAETAGRGPTRTYLLTWDPRHLPFPELEELARAIRTQWVTTHEWTVAEGTPMEPGDRVFLMRQGEDPRGIVGSGRVVGQVTRTVGPDDGGDGAGSPETVVDVAWDTLSRQPILERPELVHATRNESVWATPVGGVRLPSAVADALEEAWRVATAHPGLMDPDLDRADYLRRFDQDGLDALAEAWGLAQADGADSIHMEHLLPGLLRAGGGVFEGVLGAAGVDKEAVVRGLVSSRPTPLPERWTPEALDELPPLSRHVLQALRMAERRAEALADGTIGPRDLVNGALSIADCSVVQRLRQMGLSRSSLPWGWEPPIRLAGYWSDATAGTDLLDMTRDARVLATIMASSKVSPPLSIGLFGPWGSGKSFFMKLLQKEVRALERAEAPDYCRRVVQIRFNAWHYIDSNLWASLANEVFEQLGREIEASDGEGGGRELREERTARRTQAARLLMAARRSRSELEEATRRKEEAERELEGAEAELAHLEEEHWLLQGPVPAERVAEEALRELVADDRWREELDRVLERLGLSTRDLSPRALETRLRRWRGRWRWILGWWKALTRRGPRRWITVGAAAVFVGVVLTPWELWAGALGWLDESLATLGLLAGALLPHLDEARKIVARVRPLVDKLDEVHARARGRLEEESAARRELHEERYARAREEEKAKREQLKQVERELRTLLADDQIRRFVSQRRESEDYRKHLGVIARARQDFEQLSRLLERRPERAGDEEPMSEAERALERELDRYRDDLPRVDRIVLYIDDLDRCPEDKVVDVLQAVHLLLAFRLFVVVVGVDPRWLLHSLADRSDVFREADGGPNGEEARHRYWRTTPMDYLEKIFQIPFHLRPMGEQGFGALVTELTRDREGEAREEAAREAWEPPTPGGDPGAGATAGDAPGEGSVDAGGRPAEAEGGETAEGGDGAHAGTAPERSAPHAPAAGDGGATGSEAIGGGGDPRSGAIGGGGGDPEGAASAGAAAGAGGPAKTNAGPSGAAGAGDEPPRGPRLTIAPWERRFMQALHPFIRSPRSAKRFVNVYRLVRASHIESLMGGPARAADGPASVGDDAHHQVLFLLAMLTGHPGPSFTLFGLMKAAEGGGGWEAFRASLPGAGPPTGGGATSEGPAGTGGAPSPTGESGGVPSRSRLDREDWRELLHALDRARAEMAERGISFDPPLRELRAWIPKVARYSFRSGTAMREELEGPGLV